MGSVLLRMLTLSLNELMGVYSTNSIRILDGRSPLILQVAISNSLSTEEGRIRFWIVAIADDITVTPWWARRRSNHQPRDCLLNLLYRRRSKKTTFRITSLYEGIHRWPVNSPHKGPVTRLVFPLYDVIMAKVCSLAMHSTVFEWLLEDNLRCRALFV